MGTFTYPNTAAVKAGTCKVDFNPDRIVLYDSQDNKKMIGFVSVIHTVKASRISFAMCKLLLVYS